MARVFLINPSTDETVRSPLLSFMYLAASLRRAGHQVALLDASAPHAPHGLEEIVDTALAFEPDLVGIHTKTLYVQEAYALAAAFAGRVRLVAGGPHPTVAPLEPLSHGFDFSVRGEGEETLVELCDALDGKRDLDSVRSLVFKGNAGLQVTPVRGFLLDLDALASPLDALDPFDARWYGTAAATLARRACSPAAAARPLAPSAPIT